MEAENDLNKVNELRKEAEKKVLSDDIDSAISLLEEAKCYLSSAKENLMSVEEIDEDISLDIELSTVIARINWLKRKLEVGETNWLSIPPDEGTPVTLIPCADSVKFENPIGRKLPRGEKDELEELQHISQLLTETLSRFHQGILQKEEEYDNLCKERDQLKEYCDSLKNKIDILKHHDNFLTSTNS